MKTILLVLAAVVVASQAATYTMPMLRQWATFKVKYNKEYEHELEENLRMKTFFDNKRIIEEHNARYEQGLTTFTLGLNQFADLTLGEFTQTMLNFNKSGDAAFDQSNMQILPQVSVPESIDWREKGAVNPVKNQDACGSCWAFSAVASLESAHFLKTGTLYSLSEKQLVDCSNDYGNNGCHGGLMTNSFNYIKAMGGIESEIDYPYQPVNGVCKADNSKFIVQVASYNNVPQGDEDQLKQYVGERGPTSVAIDASQSEFLFYQSGVHYDEKCSSTQLNHGVTAVGYGNEGGKDYWLVKNSWGTTWGDQGYIKMARGKGNNCGIATMATIPVV